MSSDSDEDELLQMALKEQSQRDLNYGKSSSNSRKPVANYVQQPKKSAPPSKQSQGKGRVVDDDDDSEVEMLSISSGDEDNAKDPNASSRNRGAAAAAGRAGPRDDDRAWDGEEPSRWKHVDEAELARRVREMRETRTAPVAQKFERKASALGRKGLTYLQSFPRGMECVDPLGLGIIDNRTLRLITESSDSSPRTDKDNQDGRLREKLLYFSENFDAKLFLSRIHSNTSAADLEAGALALKTDFKSRTEQRKQLVKDNFDCFVSCKTTIDDIESKLRRIEDDPEGSGTSHLFNIIQGVSLQANRALKPLFERQAQAEKIRTVQGMLQRFRTLFNLPTTIRVSISKGEYDLAVREYKKAKSIALPSHVGILKRVLEEVEKVMNEFKSMLFKSMEDPQIDLTNLENTVRLLLDLEPESDPVWHYLNIQNQRIRGLLEKCTLDHEARMENLQNELRERALSDARWTQIQEEMSEPVSSDINNSSILDNTDPVVQSHLVDLTGEEVDALRGRYICRLTAVIIHHIPAFWKVSHSVFSGKFAKSSQVTTESNSNVSANKIEEKAGDGKYSSHSLDEVAAMICSTISLYGVKVTNIFHELEESNVLRSYMSDAIEDISKACVALELKEVAPQIAVSAIRALQSEIIRIYVLRLCSWMRASVEDVSKDVTWVIVSILERNKSPYAISYLPLTFRSVVASAMDQINSMLQSLRNEATKSEDTFMQLQEIQESVRLAFLNCFLDFAGNLERIGIELGQQRSDKEGSHLPNGYACELDKNGPSDLQGGVTDPHQQLLIVLSNIGYCKDELSYELYDKYRHIWLHSRGKDEGNSDVQDLVICFSGLEEKVLEQYTFAKANLIRSAATNYLLNSGIQWGAAPAVKGVRDAAVELLHTLVAVHAEVFAGAKPLLDKTLGILVEGLIDTFISIFHENESKDLSVLDTNGFCQLMLELEYFETILNPYFTSDARDSLKSLQGLILEKATESVTDAVDNPGHNRRPTRGSEDAIADDKQGSTVSPDELISLAQQYSSEFLQSELERTRINTACFAESIPLDSVPEPAKSAYSSFRNSVDSPSRNYRSTSNTGSSSFSRHRH
ncbi:exocyst complex component SEC5A-like isoform X3 [Abrus precatorius]|uniref:Exocyst complex component SEC5 n=1 Tax=Abrus precatorius TaxID=3816 RepID=A0A8B8M8A8_ABRPR|nr:exocyst complex component SEC5A-like isoform X3 [Abrus precatorius]